MLADGTSTNAGCKIRYLFLFSYLYILFFLFFFKNYFIVVQVQLSALTPHHSHPSHPHLSPLLPTPLGFVHVSFIAVPKNLPPIPPLSLPTSPMVTVSLFLISMSLVIFCLLFSSIAYVPVKGEIIWYLSLTTWLISLSIMLSSSIHAVAKGRSSFFLSDV